MEKPMTIVRRGGSLLLRHAETGERLEVALVAEAGVGVSSWSYLMANYPRIVSGLVHPNFFSGLSLQNPM